MQRPKFECAGKNTVGQRFESISEFWDELSKEEQGEESNWYSKSEAYWSDQTASVEGMLGGLGVLHERDILASRKFLKQLLDANLLVKGKCTRALDVGAGIGRVTKHLLLPWFDKVDMLEQSSSYLEESCRYTHGDPNPSLESKDNEFKGGEVGERMATGMQNFLASGFSSKSGKRHNSVVGAYDLVWIQWTIGYLTDEDMITFLKECVSALKPGSQSVIVLKDNVARSGFIVDAEDSSIMRSAKYLVNLFARARLRVVKLARQMDFPSGVHPVRMYALRPST